MSKQELDRRARNFDSRIRRRNSIEYVAAVAVIGTFAWMAFSVPDLLLRIACLTIIAGTFVVVRNLRGFGPRMSAPADLAADCRAYYRGELVRQRHALRSVTRWYLAPFIPGLILFQVGMGRLLARDLPLAAVAVTVGITVAFVFAVFAGIRWLNERAASQLSAEIASIDAA